MPNNKQLSVSFACVLFRCFPSALIWWRFYWAAAVVKWRRREEKSKLGLWRFGSGVFLMFLFRMLPCGDGGELSRVYCALFWWLLGLAPADLGSYEGLLVGLWTLNSMGSKLLQLFILYCVTESRVKKRMIFECPLLDLRAPSAGSTVWDVFRLCLSVRFELLPQGLNGIWTCWSDSCCWVRWDKKRKNPELLWVSYRVTRTSFVSSFYDYNSTKISTRSCRE